MHKTQVFFAPKGDHYRTRLTHTLEVSQIARTIAKALRMNESLTEAIALGHDLGHTPFGHSGEAVLSRICPYGFKHYEQSVRVVTFLENNGAGLNLTWEVIDGIRNHSTVNMPATLEGKIVRLSDKIAYINHDIDDAIRGQIITEDDIPEEFRKTIGENRKERLDNLIHDVIVTSAEKGDDILMTNEMAEAMQGLRSFMFKNVYTNNVAKAEELKAQNMLETLYGYFLENPHKMSEEYVSFIEKAGEDPHRVVCDYIAGMTDQFAIDAFTEISIPKSWKVF